MGGNRPLYRSLSPKCYLEGEGASLPVPWFAVVGSLDRLVEPVEACELYARMAKSSTSHVFALLDGAQHQFSMVPSVRTAAVTDAALALLRVVREASRPGGGHATSREPTEVGPQGEVTVHLGAGTNPPTHTEDRSCARAC